MSDTSTALDGEIIGPERLGGGEPPNVSFALQEGQKRTGRPGVAPPAYRISNKLDKALCNLVAGAQTIKDAAEQVGMNRTALSKLDRLMDARSEYVQLGAAKDLANRAGYAPPKDQLI